MPYWSAQIGSPLAAAGVEERLRRIVRPMRSMGFWERLERAVAPSGNEPPFEGEVSGRTLKMVRAITYRNSFLPVIRGVISDHPDGGTTIRLRMTLHPFTGLFLIAWLGFAGSAFVRSPMSVRQIDANLLLGAMLLFGIALPVVAFYPEALKAERMIRNALAP